MNTLIYIQLKYSILCNLYSIVLFNLEILICSFVSQTFDINVMVVAETKRIMKTCDNAIFSLGIC